jgi:NADPH:quinone reductase-like Zn-dependent oxidoreductase
VAPQPGERLLVTSGASNTSLFLIALLRSCGVEVWTTTSTPRHVPRLKAHGASGVLVLDRQFTGRDAAGMILESTGPIDAVLDPFFDLHLDAALDVLRPFGRYITCGFSGQTAESMNAARTASLRAAGILQKAMSRNLTIMGNCLGTTADLGRALDDFEAGLLQPVVDSTYGGDDVRGFLERSFSDPGRFGKVVFEYS